MDKIKILDYVIQFAVLAFSISVHEAAHAWMADRCGDPTARYLGRITLNPIAHADLIGSVIFPLVLLIIQSPVLFGWAKPVPVNPYNFRKFRRDNMIVSGAGPGSNLLIALLGTIIFVIFKNAGIFNAMGNSTAKLVILILFSLIMVNTLLAFFNLLPIPPLDGGGILESVLRGEALRVFEKVRPYGFIILLIIMYTGIFNMIISPVFNFVWKVLTSV